MPELHLRCHRNVRPDKHQIQGQTAAGFERLRRDLHKALRQAFLRSLRLQNYAQCLPEALGFAGRAVLEHDVQPTLT